MWPSGLMALNILGILMQWFLLWNTFTTKHFPHDNNYEWNIPNIHERYGSQCDTSMTITRTVVLNHLFWVFKWAGHTIQVHYAPVPLEILGSELSLLQVECVMGVEGGRREEWCQESGVLRTSLEMECGTVSRKEGEQGGGHQFPRKSVTTN